MILFHITPKDVVVTLVLLVSVCWWVQVWWDARKYRKERERTNAKSDT